MKKSTSEYNEQIVKDEAKEKVRNARDAVEAKTREAKDKADKFKVQMQAKQTQLEDARAKV